MSKVKVLYIYGGIMAYGGIEKFMMDNYRNIDSNYVQIDFVFHGTGTSPFDKELNRNNTNYFYVPTRSENPIQNFLKLSSIMKNGNYDIVHSHMDAMNAYILYIAKKTNIKFRISHGHSTRHMTDNKLKIVINDFLKLQIKNNATHLFSCSKDAGKWLYGTDAFVRGEVSVIPNAINIDKYKFSEVNRKETRKELGIGKNEILIGHVGHFDYPKNHKFIIEVLKKLSLSNTTNYKVVLIGEGHLENELRNLVIRYGLENNVIFAGTRNDVNKLLSGMDIFIFPSLFEGLGTSLIEAQANGLQCIASTKVPKEVNYTGLVNFLSLEDNIEIWTNKIIRESKKKHDRKNPFFQNILKSNGYDIKSSAKNMENIYLKMKNKEESEK